MSTAQRSVVVFDLDDTLYPEQQFVVSGLRAVGAELARSQGLAQAEETLLQVHGEGSSQGRVLDVALARLNLKAGRDDVRRLVELYRYHQPQGLTLFPDARALLDHLVGRARLAMVTDGWERCQQAKLAALGIRELFSPTVATFDYGAAWHKPSPRAFQAVMVAHGGARDEYVYIADNPAKDFGGPAGLGWRTARILRPEGVHRTAPDAGHRIDRTVEDLRELVDWLELG